MNCNLFLCVLFFHTLCLDMDSPDAAPLSGDPFENILRSDRQHKTPRVSDDEFMDWVAEARSKLSDLNAGEAPQQPHNSTPLSPEDCLRMLLGCTSTSASSTTASFAARLHAATTEPSRTTLSARLRSSGTPLQGGSSIGSMMRTQSGHVAPHSNSGTPSQGGTSLSSLMRTQSGHASLSGRAERAQPQSLRAMMLPPIDEFAGMNVDDEERVPEQAIPDTNISSPYEQGIPDTNVSSPNWETSNECRPKQANLETNLPSPYFGERPRAGKEHPALKVKRMGRSKSNRYVRHRLKKSPKPSSKSDEEIEESSNSSPFEFGTPEESKNQAEPIFPEQQSESFDYSSPEVTMNELPSQDEQSEFFTPDKTSKQQQQSAQPEDSSPEEQSDSFDFGTPQEAFSPEEESDSKADSFDFGTPEEGMKPAASSPEQPLVTFNLEPQTLPSVLEEENEEEMEEKDNEDETEEKKNGEPFYIGDFEDPGNTSPLTEQESLSLSKTQSQEFFDALSSPEKQQEQDDNSNGEGTFDGSQSNGKKENDDSSGDDKTGDSFSVLTSGKDESKDEGTVGSSTSSKKRARVEAKANSIRRQSKRIAKKSKKEKGEKKG